MYKLLLVFFTSAFLFSCGGGGANVTTTDSDTDSGSGSDSNSNSNSGTDTNSSSSTNTSLIAALPYGLHSENEVNSHSPDYIGIILNALLQDNLTISAMLFSKHYDCKSGSILYNTNAYLLTEKEDDKNQNSWNGSVTASNCTTLSSTLSGFDGVRITNTVYTDSIQSSRDATTNLINWSNLTTAIKTGELTENIIIDHLDPTDNLSREKKVTRHLNGTLRFTGPKFVSNVLYDATFIDNKEMDQKTYIGSISIDATFTDDIFLKDIAKPNLWGGMMIQEYPEEKNRKYYPKGSYVANITFDEAGVTYDLNSHGAKSIFKFNNAGKLVLAHYSK